jgi:hypothetical protein
MNQLSISPSQEIVPALVAAADDRAGVRFLELVAAQIRNPHTLRAYARSAPSGALRQDRSA